MKINEALGHLPAHTCLHIKWESLFLSEKQVMKGATWHEFHQQQDVRWAVAEVKEGHKTFVPQLLQIAYLLQEHLGVVLIPNLALFDSNSRASGSAFVNSSKAAGTNRITKFDLLIWNRCPIYAVIRTPLRFRRLVSLRFQHVLQPWQKMS